MGKPDDPTEQKIQSTGRSLLEAMRAQRPRVLQHHRWETEILRWCMADPALRTQVLRFIDVLPALTGPGQIVEHLRQYFPQESTRLPLPLRLGLTAGNILPTRGVVAAATRQTASSMARLFLAGSNFKEAFAALSPLEKEGFLFTIDLLGEATTSQAQADRHRDSTLDLIRGWTLSAPPHVSLKLSSLAFPFDPIDPEGAWAQVRPRLAAILQAAFLKRGFVNIDMEIYHLRDLVLGLTRRILEEDFPKETEVGIVIQAYLKDSFEVTQRLLDWAARRSRPITVRLVRGAYWDSEVILNRQRNWPCPVYTSKPETDASFERLTDLLMKHHSFVRVAIATHNLRSIARAIVKAQEHHAPQDRWEFQVLYGMGEVIQRAVRGLGFPVRIYAPVGEPIPGMAYLVRRMLENTSHSSFIAMSLLAEPTPELLLESPDAG